MNRECDHSGYTAVERIGRPWSFTVLEVAVWQTCRAIANARRRRTHYDCLALLQRGWLTGPHTHVHHRGRLRRRGRALSAECDPVGDGARPALVAAVSQHESAFYRDRLVRHGWLRGWHDNWGHHVTRLHDHTTFGLAGSSLLG